MTAYIAFDTCALIAIEQGENDEVMARLELLNLLYRGFRGGTICLLFDHEGQVHREYSENIPPNSMGRRLITSAATHYAVEYAPGSPSARCLRGLRRCSFDPSDVAFVSIAHHTGGIYVTSEEKHLVPKQRSCINDSCNVATLSIDELHGHLVSP